MVYVSNTVYYGLWHIVRTDIVNKELVNKTKRPKF